ncbi:MAG: glycosyltransferase [Geminicoccaceae bacterium]|nr:glycosyltransferase [Geminicoccaceae bacterium]
MSPPRFFFWVQHLLGTGHLRRALLLAEALAARGGRVLLASGGPPAGFPPPKGTEFLQLPPIGSDGADLGRLVGSRGEPLGGDIWARRRRLLLDALARHEPQVVIVEHWPFGRRAFDAEVRALLARARAIGARLVCSVRDVLVSKDDPAKYARMAEHARGLDLVLVHGDPSLLPFEARFPLARALEPELRYTGYVAPPERPAPAQTRREILVSAGGGAVGARLCATALEAARLLPEPRWRIVTGGGLSGSAFAALARAAPPRVRIERMRADLPALLARAAVSVSQAGYNTVAEALAGGTPMVLVPFETAREDEQIVRARALAACGRAALVREAELGPERLVRAVRSALATPGPLPSPVRLDGAARTAEWLLELARARAA